MLSNLKKKDLNGVMKKSKILLHSMTDGGKVSHISFITKEKISVIEMNMYHKDYHVIGYYQVDEKYHAYIEDILKVDWLLAKDNIMKINRDLLEAINESTDKKLILDNSHIDWDL
ncbi:hypothetical protein [Clostridium tagluense]|uniref:Uncharacterized protein n=1 Tax=Clostridium tagluense TaxID=360422 RepID=A0A401UTN9_9CLOT|nr:hypothetical protein [Clostridium tagluense]GCD12907.1 hypothetical protein Ctaglu_45300 [Clostridium tagluense]